ncbi:ribonuclease R family protein [Altererythrobacter sp. C41]|uniref:ribonuclease R family protein n=1 Tax=Altererythrobacter sp. C41 TaxID=2806021 RepID=UPI001933F083|nr:VacB/RNase II family 3'-5' exoribonuclease [Altererythrobacter sp. C41]MBM0168714.1 VacB/RNase II family 3'-5' exoribonuclease [Altererythrobacter sp. C41]
MSRKTHGLPSREQILEFIQTADTPAGKREIAKAFGLKGQEKIALKHRLKDMAEEGLIDGKKTAYHRMGGVPKVTVLRVVEIEDGEAFAIPDAWQPDDATPPPRLRVIEGKKGKSRQAALKTGDRVLARTEETGRGWKAHVMKKLPARTEGLMGVVEIDASGKGWLAPVDKRVRSSSPIADLGGAEEGQLVLAEPAGRSPRSGVNVVEVLGDPLAPKSFSLIAIAKHGIPHVFPEAALDEAERAAKLPLSEDKREDLRHLPIVAIDPADARDHDDAIWAEPDGEGGYRALVVIADVSFYVRAGGQIDREARKRGNSVYFPDRVVPMLPEVLSGDVCSLKQEEDRAAMACHLRISPEGKVTKWRFTRALVRIAHNVAYEDAQKAIDQGNAPEHLQHLWDAWKLLFAARNARDPLELELPERRVVLDEQGRIAEIAVRERLDAHRVVEDFMIAANVAAAKALESKTAPVVYRVHEPPSREKLVALKDYLATFGRTLALGQVITPGLFNRMLKDVTDESEKAQVMEAVLRTQTQAYYGPQNAGHFGLALGSYAHFTSPIRRYADLLVHRALVDAFGLEQPKPNGGDLAPTTGLSDRDRDDLSKVSDAISAAERRAMEAERDTIDRYVAAWLAGRMGETFDTRITGVQPFGFFATIVGLGGDGLVPVSTLGAEHFYYDEAAQALVGADSGTRYASGDRLKLRLGEANPLTGALKFEPLDANGRAIEPRGDRPPPRGQKKGKYIQGKRGRPGNIRHQGRGKKR